MLLIRIVQSDPPTLVDFLSNGEKGRKPRRPFAREEAEMWWGLSTFNTIDGAADLAGRSPNLGRFAATIDTERAEARVEKTAGPGHFTVFGTPVALLAAVVSVVPLS